MESNDSCRWIFKVGRSFGRLTPSRCPTGRTSLWTPVLASCLRGLVTLWFYLRNFMIFQMLDYIRLEPIADVLVIQRILWQLSHQIKHGFTHIFVM